MKKTSFWRLLGFLGAILVLLTACGKQSSAAKSSSSSAPVKITYWHRMTGSYDKALNKLITKFNQSQKKYKVVATSQGSYNALQQKIMAAGKSKTLPTMAQSPYTNIGDYVKNQLLLPFDSEMLNGSDKLSSSQLKDIYPSFLAAGKYKGKYYGLPFSVSTSVLFYNKRLMSQYNISMPKTWADFAADQDKLKGTDINAVELDQSYDVPLEGMAYGAGSQLITPKLKANLNAPKTLAAVNQILDLRKSGALKTAGEDQYFSVPFANGKAVFGIGSSATVPVLLQQAPKNLEWGTAVIPEYEGKRSNPLNGNYNVLFKGASKAQQAGAWAFQKFLLKSENASQWAMDSGYVPVTKSASNSTTFKNYLKKHEQYKAAISAVPQSFASTVFAGYTDYRNDLMSTVDSTLTKNVSGETAFDQLQKQTEKILKENQ
ncbi:MULTISPECIES: ABC transporter substrate-binding protein [Lacticaseibacillus]|uniref:ABC transporter substrate-binding protein n=2 Tax=Lacticaseibacillus TaxID=2759736 RepID=A0AAN1C652_LACCA|nr:MULTISPECIES: ABC transporter substrate-binding protein [Lacticaseibacillus]ARY90487.1 ABC transporter substrate-binding protein [Lacticaseibacillus casei]KAB1970344.1 ABC transporter substrate-binding protein [Lacticaseibacillus casei]WLV81107.1 ABC transporter substrate-binding protein [Lacticaseibacillus sp. NCIMB 15473]WNX25066.1 ABC transporter substrate-binding protein [Lacticaseibacillus casei]WNX27838.1 ABC transporter substrate-binding protein [Lacticaseibacillus casei]